MAHPSAAGGNPGLRNRGAGTPFDSDAKPDAPNVLLLSTLPETFRKPMISG